MIEVTPTQQNDDDLFTEPNEPKKQEDKNYEYCMASSIADFYIGLRRRGIHRRFAKQLTRDFMRFCMEAVKRW